MSDIVKRLGKLEACERELAHECDCPPEVTANWAYADTCAEAAAEIERLRAEVERKDAALERLVRAKEEKDKHGDTPVYQALKKSAWESARAALNPSQEPRT